MEYFYSYNPGIGERLGKAVGAVYAQNSGMSKEARILPLLQRAVRNAAGLKTGQRFTGNPNATILNRAKTTAKNTGKISVNPRYGVLRRRQGMPAGVRKLDKTRQAAGAVRKNVSYGGLGLGVYELIQGLLGGLNHLSELPGHIIDIILDLPKDSIVETAKNNKNNMLSGAGLGLRMANAAAKTPYGRKNIAAATRKGMQSSYDNQTITDKALELNRYTSPVGAILNLAKRNWADGSDLPVINDARRAKEIAGYANQAKKTTKKIIDRGRPIAEFMFGEETSNSSITAAGSAKAVSNKQ